MRELAFLVNTNLPNTKKLRLSWGQWGRGESLDQNRQRRKLAVTAAHLKEMIALGQFGPGARLDQDLPNLLATQSEQTAALSREACALLVGHGLVALKSNDGYYVEQTSAEDLQEVMAVRFLLQGTALRAAIATGGAEWERNLNRAYKRLRSFRPLGKEQERQDIDRNLLEFLGRYREFHQSLISACRVAKLLSFIDILLEQGARYCRPADTVTPQAEDIRKPLQCWRDLEGHERILLATLEHDAEAACEELRFHLLTRIGAPSQDSTMLN